jgi:tRNA(fMet)-specific endonuclease VapC
MIILDTDHLSALQVRYGERGEYLRRRMARSADQDFTVTAITIEEQLRGWLAEIAANADPVKQVGVYARLVGLVRFFAAWRVLPFDDDAAVQCNELRRLRVRTGTMDMKIAATALARDALLLTANTQDFARIPGLRMQNWLM